MKYRLAVFALFCTITLSAIAGEFQACLSCDLTSATIRLAKPKRITAGLAGKLTRVACDCGTDITFVQRTCTQCKVAGDGNCSDAADCKAICN